MNNEQEPKLNDVVTQALAELMTPMPSPVVHGYFNRRMFMEAFVHKAGLGVSIESDDIKEHCAMTDKEFNIILKEYIDKGIVVKVDNMFGADLYKLNLTV